MNKYEAMFILRPDLSEEDKKSLFNQLSDALTKHNGKATSQGIWAEKRKLYFSLKKCQEGLYYLMNFDALPACIKDIRHAYQLNENILRVLVTRIDQK